MEAHSYQAHLGNVVLCIAFASIMLFLPAVASFYYLQLDYKPLWLMVVAWFLVLFGSRNNFREIVAIDEKSIVIKTKEWETIIPTIEITAMRRVLLPRGILLVRGAADQSNYINGCMYRGSDWQNFEQKLRIVAESQGLTIRNILFPLGKSAR